MTYWNRWTHEKYQEIINTAEEMLSKTITHYDYLQKALKAIKFLGITFLNIEEVSGNITPKESEDYRKKIEEGYIKSRESLVGKLEETRFPNHPTIKERTKKT